MHFTDVDQKCINMKIVNKQQHQLQKILDYVEILQESWQDVIKKRNYILNLIRERMHPLCLAAFNDARECVFKADGNIFNCKKEA